MENFTKFWDKLINILVIIALHNIEVKIIFHTH